MDYSIIFRLPVFRGRYAHSFSECSGKIHSVLISCGACHCTYGKVCGSKQIFCSAHTAADKVLRRSYAQLRLKEPEKGYSGDIRRIGDIVRRNGQRIICLDKRLCRLQPAQIPVLTQLRRGGFFMSSDKRI